MTKRHHRYLAALFTAKPVLADNRYGVHVLDATATEIMPAGPSITHRDQQLADRNYRRRESEPSDPWLSPTRSEAVRALLIFIEGAQLHTLVDELPELSWDLREFCEDAELSPRETDVLVLAGDGWNQQRIASWLEVDQATVSRRLHSGRRKLSGWLPLEVAYRLAAA